MLITGKFNLAILYIGLASIMDFGDGLTARAFKVQSNIGKELDSLADMVSFGFIPGLILFMLFQIGFQANESIFNQSLSGFGSKLLETPYLYGFTGFLVTLFSALRLAKFNLDTRQSESFIGLNTPSNTFLIVGFLFIYIENTFGLRDLMINPIFLTIASIVLSILLVSELPMFSLKFKKLQWKDNEVKISFLLLSILLFILFKGPAIALIMLTYITFAIISNLFKKQV